LRVVKDACATIGRDGAIVVLQSKAKGSIVHEWLPQALRGWCESRFPERDEAVYTRVFGAAAGPEVLTTSGTAGEPTRFGDLALRLWRPLLAEEVLR